MLNTVAFSVLTTILAGTFTSGKLGVRSKERPDPSCPGRTAGLVPPGQEKWTNQRNEQAQNSNYTIPMSHLRKRKRKTGHEWSQHSKAHLCFMQSPRDHLSSWAVAHKAPTSCPLSIFSPRSVVKMTPPPEAKPPWKSRAKPLRVPEPHPDGKALVT